MSTAATDDDKGEAIRFAECSEEMPRAADQERLDCLAAAVLNQQRAGFKSYVDTREAKCADCGASGFNTGWGFWHFACGLEILSDGEPREPCGRTQPQDA